MELGASALRPAIGSDDFSGRLATLQPLTFLRMSVLLSFRRAVSVSDIHRSVLHCRSEVGARLCSILPNFFLAKSSPFILPFTTFFPADLVTLATRVSTQ